MWRYAAAPDSPRCSNPELSRIVNRELTRKSLEVSVMKRSLIAIARVAVGAAAVLVIAAIGSAAANSTQQSSATAPAKEIARFQEELAKAGYVVQEGQVGIYDFDLAYCSNVIWTADWPNPRSPYISAAMPPVPGQPVANSGPNEYRLREDEAVVAIGMTPPPVAYFSFNMHMFRGSLINSVGPPLLWIPVGDPINNGMVRTAGPTPYNQPFAAVFTGHRRTQTDVHAMLRKAGLQQAINDQALPPALFRLGLDPGPDPLNRRTDAVAFAMRTAVAENQQALDEYLAGFNNPVAQRPIRMFRVRPLASGHDQIAPVFAPDPLPVPPLRVAGTGTTELDLFPTLLLLKERIIAAHPGYTATDLPVDPLFEQPYPGLQRTKGWLILPPGQLGVAGATSDATYLGSGDFTLPSGAFLVAYGAHHRATGKASYSSVSVYADPVATVGLATVQSPKLQDSARDYINDQPKADMFYAWTFTRGTTGGSHVSQLLASDYCQTNYPGTSRAVDLNTLRIIVRSYMDPATKTRPAEPEMLFDRLLMFTPN